MRTRPPRPVSARARGDRIADSDLLRRRRPHAQLVRDHLEAHQRTHPRHQRDVGDRLGQEVVRARFQPPHPVGRLAERGDHDDRNMMRRRIGFEAAANFEAVQIRHQHVEQDDIAQPPPANCQRLLPAHRDHDIEIFRGESRLQQLDVGEHVVDDQDPRRHRVPLMPRRGTDGRFREICRPRSASTDRLRSRPPGFAPHRPSWRRP